MTIVDLDLSRCQYPPFAHQVIGVQALVRQPYFFLADEMGAAKSAQVILAAQVLYEQGVIDKVLIVCPGSVRAVWFDKELGELRKHLWDSTPARIWQFHSRVRKWTSGPPSANPLVFVVTNYEFVRNPSRAKQLLRQFCTPKTLLVCDESSSVKSHGSDQFKQCLILRKNCGRVVLLSGTPIANNPMDLFAQGMLLNKHILESPFITYFRAKYAIIAPILGRDGRVLTDPRGRPLQKISGWRNLDDLQRRFAPHVLRRLKKDCLDLPPKLDPVTLKATLTPEEWRHYKAMRDQMVVQLSSTDYSQAQQAVTKMVRLAQITSGFLGGIERLFTQDLLSEESDDLEDLPSVREIGRAKLDVFLAWLDNRLEDQPSFKLVVGCRFRSELHRTAQEIARLWPEVAVGKIYGSQPAAERTTAVRLLDPRTAPEGPAVVLMTSAGNLGINLTAAHTFIRLSRDFSLFQSLQADDRLHRIGQTEAVSYYDIIAEGPSGQPTIDKIILQAVRAKHDVAEWTASAWVRALTADVEDVDGKLQRTEVF